MAAIDFIETLWPEAATRSDIEPQLAIAAISSSGFPETVIDSTLGTIKDYATALRAMHNIASVENSKVSGYTGGNVSSEKEGDLSKTYAISDRLKEKYPDLYQTVWGVKLIALIEENFMLPVTSRTFDF